MARLVTLQSVADRARLYADMRNSSFISDTEMVALINDAYAALYDQMITSYENYFHTTTTIPIFTNTRVYNLPSDFYKLIGVDFQVNGDQYITIQPYMESERNLSLTTSVTIPSGNVKFRYIPVPPTFTALTDTFDGQGAWDKAVALMVAIDMADAEESDTDRLYRKLKDTTQRIEVTMGRDVGMPARVTDVYRPNIQRIYGALRYRLYANTVEFVTTEFLGADGLYGNYI